MKYLIHYFSGTGNTIRAVKIIKTQLEKAGNTVVLHRIMDGKPNDLSAEHHIFAFPVLAMSAPSFVKQYWNSLPKADNVPATVICTYAGGSGLALVNAASILRKKGYRIGLAGSCKYTDSWTQFFSPGSPETVSEELKKGDEDASVIATDILSGKTGFQSSPLLGRIFTPMMIFLFGLIGRRFMGKTYIADHRCTDCGLCVNSCPVQTIVRTKTKKHYWLFNCEDCCRCINICPQKAIQNSAFRFYFYVTLNVLSIVGLILATKAVESSVFGLLGKFWGIVALIAGNIIGAVISIVFMFTVLDLLLFAIQEIPFVKPLFERSRTQKYGRYKAPGFNPSKD